MRTLSLMIASLSLLVACNAGTIEGDVKDDDGAADAGGDEGEGEGEEDTGEDEEEVDEEPPPSIEDWEGDWVGIVSLDAFGEDYFDGCSGEIELDVDLDGEVEGDGFCEYGRDGAGVEFEGEINAEGDFEGTIIIDFQYAGETPAELSGWADGEDALEAEFEGTYEREGWGGSTVYDMTGSLTLERD